jgi:hypothetical protein
MLYLLAIIAAAILVPLFIFVGIWGGLLWIVVAAITLVVLFVRNSREIVRARRAKEPTGTEPASRGDAETANERVEGAR